MWIQPYLPGITNPSSQYGPLDQGWWPDGLLTPPSEESDVVGHGAVEEDGIQYDP